MPNLTGKLIMLALMLSLSACTSSNGFVGSNEIGYWVDGKPRKWSVWQCVESLKPHRNKECK